jgi:hypothetical protein
MQSTPKQETAIKSFAARCDEARARLRTQMEAMGLRAAEGWRISEVIRPSRDGTELVMRPIHRFLDPPAELECVVWIDSEGESIGMECHEPGGG